MTCRRTRAFDHRGNSHDRRRSKNWLLSPAAGFGGDGIKVACWECGKMVDYDGLVRDRIISGEDGGRYVRANIRPQCALCSHRQGGLRTQAILAAQRANDPYGPDDLCVRCGAHYLGTHAEGCPTPGLDGHL